MTNFTSKASEIQVNKWNLFRKSTIEELIIILLHGHQKGRNWFWFINWRQFLFHVGWSHWRRIINRSILTLHMTSNVYEMLSLYRQQYNVTVEANGAWENSSISVDFGNKVHSNTQRWLAHGTYPCMAYYIHGRTCCCKTKKLRGQNGSSRYFWGTH